MSESARLEILEGLRDAVLDSEIFASFQTEAAFQTSLLRSISKADLEKLRDIVREQAILTSFNFEYEFPEDQSARVQVGVHPGAVPPTNIHAIIGLNGVGKSSLLRNISTLLRERRRRRVGKLKFFSKNNEVGPDEGFSNLVVVAFSAFDEFEPPAPNAGTETGIQYAYIGLRKNVRLKDGSRESRNKTSADLRLDFVKSTLLCLRSSRRPRWREAMRVLETDPGFAGLKLQVLADVPQDEFEVEAGKLFDAASSGHKIVLLTMTKLVELVSERTLVLIDEPESHLHPPLVAAFIRALSDLLSLRNGVALLATHSPVVVQEIPRSCVSLFFREGRSVSIERPAIETFAENVSLLTREIFRVELTETGYHTLMRATVDGATSVEDAIARFEGRLGAEGRSLIRALWQER